MSLLTEVMVKCTLLVQTNVDDDCGGYDSAYTPSVEFDAAISFDNSTEARKAEKDGVTNLYTVSTSRGMHLEYHDVFKRNSDGKIFRVTSDGDDAYTPASATLDMRIVSAEEWELPNDEQGTSDT